MYRATVDLRVVNGLGSEYDIGSGESLADVKTTVEAWLKSYSLHVYQWDDTFVSVSGLIVGYTRGNSSYDAVAWIKENG